MNKLLAISYKLGGYKLNEWIIKTFGKKVRIFCGEDGFCWFAKLGGWVTALEPTTTDACYVESIDWED